MADRVIYPEWRGQHGTTKYPFAENASLLNDAGIALMEGIILDAILYPIGGGVGMYLSKVEVEHDEATLYIGTVSQPELASCTFDIVIPPDELPLLDSHGRSAGLLVSESARLAVFQSLGVGTHEFRRDQTEFVASVCVPMPENGIRGILLSDGTLLTGDVWLVGDDGVILRHETQILPATDTLPVRSQEVIRVHVVGDPLFRRRMCIPRELFTTPRFIRTIRVTDEEGHDFEITPDEFGNITMVGNNSLASDTVLRIVPTNDGLRISAVGDILDSARG